MEFWDILMIAASEGGGAAVIAGPELWPQPAWAASTGLTLGGSGAVSGGQFTSTGAGGTCRNTNAIALPAGTYRFVTSFNQNDGGIVLRVGCTTALAGGTSTSLVLGSGTNITRDLVLAADADASHQYIGFTALDVTVITALSVTKIA